MYYFNGKLHALTVRDNLRCISALILSIFATSYLLIATVLNGRITK